jgi:UDP-N-acetylmuramoyl-tripeptide--D-alanyl-D-alanine ligase
MRFTGASPAEAFRIAQTKIIKFARSRSAAHNRRLSRATFIAVTGSSAKSTTTALIAHILSAAAPVQAQFISNGRGAHINALQTRPPRGGYFVGEVGVDGPDTLLPMLRLLKPSVGVVTLVAFEHKSAFDSVEAVAQEKQRLVEALPAGGLAVLNYDDPRVSRMAQCTKARVVTFGQTGGDYVVSDACCEVPGKLRLTITHQSNRFDITAGLTGVHNSVAIAAAFACTEQLGVPPAVIIERLTNFVPLFGRCSVHHVENGPIFVADTVKAPQHSIQLVLDLLAGFSAPRKRIVIGQISDNMKSDRIYRKVYCAARLVTDQVIFVGDHSHRAKATAEEVAAGCFKGFADVRQAAAFVKESAIADEIIVLKSSGNFHLERLMLDFFSPVRCWPNACGKKNPCVGVHGEGCGLFAIPFEQHDSSTCRAGHGTGKAPYFAGG